MLAPRDANLAPATKPYQPNLTPRHQKTLRKPDECVPHKGLPRPLECVPIRVSRESVLIIVWKMQENRDNRP